MMKWQPILLKILEIFTACTKKAGHNNEQNSPREKVFDLLWTTNVPADEVLVLKLL